MAKIRKRGKSGIPLHPHRRVRKMEIRILKRRSEKEDTKEVEYLILSHKERGEKNSQEGRLFNS